MPCIQLTASKKLSNEQKISIKSQLGKLISIIPGKSENVLMIAFYDGTDIFYAGELKENAAFISVNIHGECSFDEKNELTKGVFCLMEKEVSINKEDMFITISEYPNWGFQGKLL